MIISIAVGLDEAQAIKCSQINWFAVLMKKVCETVDSGLEGCLQLTSDAGCYYLPLNHHMCGLSRVPLCVQIHQVAPHRPTGRHYIATYFPSLGLARQL